jgi:hypothetical protein
MRRTTGGLAVLLSVGAYVAVASPAYADHNSNGNGSGNHNTVSIRSPTINHGKQIISNANAGGVTSSRNAICKHQKVCTIRQYGWP